MRRSIGRSWRIPNDQYNVLLNNTPFLHQLATPFSTSGRGRGRGGGFSPGPSKFGFTREDDEPERESSEQTPVSFGHGRGRPSGHVPPPSFGSFVREPQIGFSRGRGGGGPRDGDRPPMNSQSRQPNFIPKKDGGDFDFDSTRESVSKPNPNPNPTQFNGASLQSSVVSGLSGAGRGKPMKQPDPAQPKEENRHLRVRSPARDQSSAQPESKADASPAQPKLSQEEAIKKAMGVLGRGDDNQGGVGGAVRGGRGGGGGRGRGMGRGGRGRGGKFLGGRGNVKRSGDEEDDPYGGAEEDELKFLEMIGPENADEFIDGFEETLEKVSPSPMHQAYVNAFHTNCMLEFEPEYLVGDLCSNPDVDDKPIIPLRDALEKMKPFLVAYDGIQNQEEWEEAVKQTMEQQVPLWEKIIDQYCGPDRITAKKQQEELENVAKNVPNSAPASVKHFTNRALLSIQNNPSWGFNKKYQFMDKLVREVSQ